MIETDVLIVGGGPAGAACARRLVQRGADCILVDQAEFPRFKPCAGWITPEVARELELEAAGYPHPFTTFTHMRVSFDGLRLRVPTRQHAIRRVEFDAWLLERSGARVYRHAVKTIREEGGAYIVDERFRARYLVGAGGTYCPVYRALFKETSPRGREELIAAQEEEFAAQPASPDCWLWFWKDLRGYAWYVPKAGGWVNVGIGAWASSLGFGGLRPHWERLLEQIGRSGLVGGRAWKPAGHSYYLRRNLSTLRVGNAFLVGDSAGAATLDMGEGIGPAVRSGLRAAEAITAGAPYTLAGLGRYSEGPLLGRLLGAVYGRGR